MKNIRQFVCGLFIIFLTACNLASPTPNAQSAGESTTSLPQSISTQPAALTGNADVIFTNGRIITMDDANPSAQAIAIQGDKILTVGANDEVMEHRGSSTTVIDLEGCTVTPGFIDSHQHRIGDRWKRNYAEADPVIQIAIEQGWTTLDELFVNQDRLNELISLDGEGRLHLRVNAYLPVMDNSPEGKMMDPYYENYAPGQTISPRVRVAGLKIFTDFDNATILSWEQEDLNTFLLKLHQEGWQLAVRTVSSRSLEMILKSFEYIESIDPNVINRRGRLEHVLFLTPEQIAHVEHLGLIPSIQTNMPAALIGSQDLPFLLAREPQGSAFPWRSLVESKIIVANGSAWPSTYVDEPTGAPFGSPIHLVYQAVTRVGNLGTQPEAWMLDQTITAEQALRSLTIDAAYANFQEDILGSLKSGKLADMVILSDNPLQTGLDDLNDINVLMTMIAGKAEYCGAEFESLCLTTTTSEAPAASSPVPQLEAFTGTWYGPDPDDGSEVTVSLIQAGDGLTGTFSDTFSGVIPPPGFEGDGSGSLLSDISAQMTFSLTRSDGKTPSIEFALTLSNQNNTLTLTYEGGPPIILQRQ